VPLTALALLIAAAALHTGWNLLVKRAVEKQVFAWWAMIVGTVCFAPLLMFSPALPAAVWPYVFASALVEALYYVALTRAYTIGDFSLVYPLARGAAPAFLALWAALFLGERPQVGGLAGLALLLVGLLLVGGASATLSAAHAPALMQGRQAAPAQRGVMAFAASGIGAALAVACCISIYSAIDGAAVRIAPPIAYTIAVIGVSALMMAPLVLMRYGRQRVAAEWRANWRQIVLVGALTLVTYAMVLQAYAIGRVGYAGAIREISVVFAALVGWRWLGEGFGAARLAGALLIFAGIVMIAILG
jgi:drug/metabolite transporter (DMT)-like permease